MSITTNEQGEKEFSADDFFGGGGGETAAFRADDPVGYTVSGYVVRDPEVVDQWTYVSKADKERGIKSVKDTWPDGKPKKQMLVDVQTDLEEGDEDTGIRRLYVKYKLQYAFRDALRDAGIKGAPKKGDEVTVTYVGREIGKKLVEVEPTDRAGLREWEKSPKMFEVTISRPDKKGAVAAAFLGNDEPEAEKPVRARPAAQDDEDERPAKRPSKVEELGDEDDEAPVRTSGGRTARPALSEAQKAKMRERGIDVD